jgi:hypothetical protein
MERSLLSAAQMQILCHAEAIAGASLDARRPLRQKVTMLQIRRSA